MGERLPQGDLGRALRSAVGHDLRRAMRARDRGRAAALRSVLAAIDNAEAVDAVQAFDYTLPGLGATEAPRRVLDGDAVRALLDREIAERRSAAAVFRDAGRPTPAEALDAECLLLAEYLDALPWLGPPRVRTLDAASEVPMVAERMRDTLVEVLGEARGGSMFTPDQLAQRVQWHLDPDHVAAAWVVEDAEGRVVGHAMARVEDGAGLFATFYVVREARRAGVAGRLVDRGEAWFGERGLGLARTYTHPDNVAFISLFRARGYRLAPASDEFVSLERTLA